MFFLGELLIMEIITILSGKPNLFKPYSHMGYISQISEPRLLYRRISFLRLTEFLKLIRKKLLSILHRVKDIGVTTTMNEHEKSKLGIFNHLNFFQLITGVVVTIFGLIYGGKIPVGGWFLAHRHGRLQGFVDANQNGVDDRLEGPGKTPAG